MLARAEVIPSKNIFHAVIAYQKTNISKEIHKPRTLYIDKRTYQSKFLIQIHVKKGYPNLLGKKGYVVVVVVDSCESASCFIYLVKETKVAPSIFSS